MRDAFGEEIVIGSKVVYSSGRHYVIGEIVGFHPHKPDPKKSYTPPDRVSVKPIKTTFAIEMSSTPIVYASNVVIMKELNE